MASFLVDESCPQAVADSLRDAGHDARYAADTNRRADDAALVGELLVRHRLQAPGAIVLHMPKSDPQTRAKRLIAVLKIKDLEFVGKLTIVSSRQVRQRPIGP